MSGFGTFRVVGGTPGPLGRGREGHPHPEGDPQPHRKARKSEKKKKKEEEEKEKGSGKKRKKRVRHAASSSSESDSSSSNSSSSSSSSSSSEVLSKKRRRKRIQEESSSSCGSSPDRPRDGETKGRAKGASEEAPREVMEPPGPSHDDMEFDQLLGRTSKQLGALRREEQPQPPKRQMKELNPYWALNRTGLPHKADVAEPPEGHPGLERGESNRRSSHSQGSHPEGQFEYMGKWQPEAGAEDGGRPKPRGKKEAVYFDKEASNFRVEDLERDKFLETKQSKLIDYKKMNAQRLKHDCWFCLDTIKADKRLVAALGNRVYLALPARGALCEGHCLIVPMDHRVSARDFDSEELLEVRNFKKSLIRMFDAKGRTPVFMETVIRLKQFRHTYIECVPVESEDAEIFFYNELDKAENEFRTSSKRVINTKGRSLQSSMPEGFAYFHVEFGVDGGLLHLIEDEAGWNPNFGRDIAGGLLGCDALGRTQRSTAMQEALKMNDFLAAFRPYDWTAALAGGDY